MAAPLAERFYSVLISQPRASYYLNQKVVTDRLTPALEKWVVDLFDARQEDPERMIRRQTEIGNVHARIQVPISLVMRGFRELTQGMTEEIKHTRLSHEDAIIGVHFVATLFDIAFSVMTAAYITGSERVARADEALRLFTASQDIVTERERQRAALAEWAQTFFFDAQFPSESGQSPQLNQSEFGLWFLHKANLLFQQSAEYDAVVTTMGMIDALAAEITLDLDGAKRQAKIKSVKQMIDRISTDLSTLFERSQQSENARDPLTRVFNRRFLSPMLSREIAFHRETGRPLSVILFEVEGATKLRDTHGDADADQIIQRTATMLFSHIRRSDSIFRMGEKTFLVIRVESDADKARDFARNMATRYATTHFDIGGRVHLNNTLSFAIAEFDGHPDPRHLIVRVERELRTSISPA